MDDCVTFLGAKENGGERAATLGWDDLALFAARARPLDHQGSAGLLWHVNGGRIVELRHDWAVIERAEDGSRRVHHRRRLVPRTVTFRGPGFDRRPPLRRNDEERRCSILSRTLLPPSAVTYGEPQMATIIVGPPMGTGRRRTWTTRRLPAQQFFDRQGIGVLIRWLSAMRVKRIAGHLWRGGADPPPGQASKPLKRLELAKSTLQIILVDDQPARFRAGSLRA